MEVVWVCGFLWWWWCGKKSEIVVIFWWWVDYFSSWYLEWFVVVVLKFFLLPSSLWWATPIIILSFLLFLLKLDQHTLHVLIGQLSFTLIQFSIYFLLCFFRGWLVVWWKAVSDSNLDIASEDNELSGTVLVLFSSMSESSVTHSSDNLWNKKE